MNRLILNADQAQHRISRHLYGHFAEHLGRCIYDGLWVGPDSPIPNTRGVRNDLVAALRRARIPNLRWPGGCFADMYNWRDGIGPRAARPRRLNRHWGGVVEDNSFGTLEFIDLCDQLGCEPYICGNLGSGSPREMMDWLEYLTCPAGSTLADLRIAHGRAAPVKLRFWGVGNENWGCGGNMRPEFYADLYRQFQTYCLGAPGAALDKIAGGPCGADYRWTEVLMREAARHMQGLALHYYTVCGSWQQKSSATEFGESEWFETLHKAGEMEELVTRHAHIMDQYDPQRRVALVVDEWGTWHRCEQGTNPAFLYQQNTMRDALVAGLTLNVFNRHAARVRLACLAQTVNVLQAMCLTDGPRLVLTPTYHVFAMYAAHQEGLLVPTHLEGPNYGGDKAAMPALSASASRNPDGVLHVSLCNADAQREHELRLDVRGAAVGSITGELLTDARMSAHNTFDAPDAVRPQPFAGVTRHGAEWRMAVPARSVLVLALRG